MQLLAADQVLERGVLRPGAQPRLDPRRLALDRRLAVAGLQPEHPPSFWREYHDLRVLSPACWHDSPGDRVPPPAPCRGVSGAGPACRGVVTLPPTSVERVRDRRRARALAQRLQAVGLLKRAQHPVVRDPLAVLACLDVRAGEDRGDLVARAPVVLVPG